MNEWVKFHASLDPSFADASLQAITRTRTFLRPTRKLFFFSQSARVQNNPHFNHILKITSRTDFEEILCWGCVLPEKEMIRFWWRPDPFFDSGCSQNCFR